MNRRELLRALAYGTVAAGATSASSCTGDQEPSGRAERSAGASPLENRRRASDGKLLVVVELTGGNDGLSTLVPYDEGRYHDLRPTTAIGGDGVIDYAAGLGLNRRLERLHAHGPALIQGIGTPNPDLSHFAMLDRWWRGTVDGRADDTALGDTGFLGRICDRLRGDERFTGLSMTFGSPRIMRAARAATSGLPAAKGSLAFDPNPDVHTALLRTYEDLATPGPDRTFAEARDGLAHMGWLTGILRSLPAPSAGYPDTVFGLQMQLASRVARSDHGVRVIHVPVDGAPYDTHQHHNEQYGPLLDDLDASLGAFLRDLDDSSLAPHTLVATVSEFGRRADEHNGGLDHGAASTLLAFGPVTTGLHGEPSPLDRLDPTNSLRATVHFDRYLATLASWMEVDPADVLPRSAGTAPRPLDSFLRA